MVVSEGRSQPMMSSIRCEARMSKTVQKKERVRSDGEIFESIKLMNDHNFVQYKQFVLI